MGLVSDFAFDPGIDKTMEYFMKPTKVTPAQRKCITKQVNEWLASGVIEQSPDVTIMVNAVLVEQG